MITPGAKVGGLRPEMVLAFAIAQPIFERYGALCTITSALDGKHSRGSLHYKGLALDLRSRNLMETDKGNVLGELKRDLGFEYDVLLEDSGGPNEHFHIEFDPKT